jgi:hypothetical protein
MSQFASSAGLQIETTSRYKQTPLVQTGPTEYEWGLWVSDRRIAQDQGYTLWQIRDIDVGRLDRVSHEVYGTSAYWWMIAHANAFRNPIRDMVVGEFMRIPRQAVCDRYTQASPV